MKRIIIIFPVALFLFSFSSKSRLTVYDFKYIEKNLVYIPTGTYTPASDMDLREHGRPRLLSVESFYMFNEEVSNGFYCRYLREIRKKGDTAAYHRVLPDTLVWREKLAYNEPYVEYYLRHPAYDRYPVVGVSYHQCLEFCAWMTATYNNWPDRKFKKVVFDLPDSSQWEYAARGGQEFAEFPWKGWGMQNEKGEWMANFRTMGQAGIRRMEFETTSAHGIKYMETYYVASGGGDDMGVAGRFNDAADITAPVRSYWPNAFGLYNMAGNVEEFIKTEGKSKGGSWRDPGFYLQNSVYETYDPAQSASTERGFRFIMKVIEQ